MVKLGKDLKEVFESVWEFHKELSIKGDLVPGALFISEAPKESGFIPFECQSEEDKRRYSFMIHAMARKLDPDIIVFTTEGWGLIQNPEDKDPLGKYHDSIKKYGSLEHAPGRQELLIVAASDRDGNRLTRIGEITRAKRDDGKDVVDIQEICKEDDMGFTSRFVPEGWGGPLDDFDISGMTK